MRNFLLALSLLAALVALPGRPGAAQATKRLTLEMVNGAGRGGGGGRGAGPSRPAWHPDGSLVYYKPTGMGPQTGQALTRMDPESGVETTLLSPADPRERAALMSAQWSPKGDALLFRSENDLWLLEVATGKKRRLTNDAQPEEGASFAPTGGRVAFVKRSNLYALDLATGAVEQLTADGTDLILNGQLDWVYGEEFGSRGSRAYEWSPDGKKIAFLRLDQTRVPEYPIVDFSAANGRLTRQRYPKAGDPNSIPSVHAVAVGGEAGRAWTVPLAPGVEYVGPEFSWTQDGREVAFLTLNRGQNELALHLWDPPYGRDRTLFVERDAAWINSLEPPTFLKDGQRFLWLSERDGWLHAYLYHRDGRLLNQVTRGDWQLDRPSRFAGVGLPVDEAGGWLYFSSTEASPLERQVYRVRLDGSGFQRLTREPGAHSFQLSPDGRYLLESFSGSDHPPTTRLLRADGSLVHVVTRTEPRPADYPQATSEIVQVRAPDGALLYARLTKPADFDPAMRYPVIIRVYGGPQAQSVRNSWNQPSMMDHYLAQEGHLIWQLDNRGTAGRGRAWETAIFKNLGRKELDDQLAGVAYLKSLPYVDGGRFAIWGWSYGGYMTLYALTHAPDVFRCGIAGAPVTDWRYYDTIYTERYMRTPQENPEGYKASSNVEAAGQLKAKLLLIHGTADNNVHLQNTMQFLDALTRARRTCELYIQPGSGHGFGPGAGPYLNERVVDFLKRNL